MEPVAEFFGYYDVMNYDLTHYAIALYCGIWTENCQIGIAFTATNNLKPLDFKKMKAYFGHYPAGSSIKCGKHFMQIIAAKKFQEYDYDSSMNMRLYG